MEVLNIRKWTEGELACRSCVLAKKQCLVLVDRDNGAHACWECYIRKRKCPLAEAMSPILGYGTMVNNEMVNDLLWEAPNPDARSRRSVLKIVERKWAMPVDFGGILMHLVASLRVVRDDSTHLLSEIQKLKEIQERLPAYVAVAVLEAIARTPPRTATIASIPTKGTVIKLPSSQNDQKLTAADNTRGQEAQALRTLTLAPAGLTTVAAKETTSLARDHDTDVSSRNRPIELSLQDDNGSSSGKISKNCESYITSGKHHPHRPDRMVQFANEDGWKPL